MSWTTALLAVALAFSGHFIAPLHAVGFLKSSSDVPDRRLSEANIRTSFLSEIEAASGSFDTSRKISQLKEVLQPIFVALPKNKYGNLERNAVRYALHRAFVLRHGWVIRGLSPHDRTQNSSSPTGVLKENVAAYIEDMFEKQGKGLQLQDLAILGATLEHLIHDEAVEKLGEVYDLHGLLPTDVIEPIVADQLLDTYMMGHIRSRSLKNVTLAEATEAVREMPSVYLAWGETQKFVQGIRTSITTQNRVDFTAMSKVVGTVNERFGSFQDKDCGDVKASLMKMDYRGTGRVKLSDFYAPARNGQWQFQENVAYLKQLGAIDDFDQKNPSVIIPNYVASHANCIAASGFYTICCKNECEGIFGYLERAIAAPEAKPGVIATLVETLSSSTVRAPRELSANLRRRLDDIAIGHDGAVPLHGRLFAQWMHHAYPLECPFPHVVGTTFAQTAEEWEAANGIISIADNDEMNLYTIKASAAVSLTDASKTDEAVAPWSFEEELVLGRTSSQSWSAVLTRMRSLILIIASASLALSLFQSSKSRSRMGKNVELKMV